METKRIVCAAVRRGSRVALGARHYDDFMIALLGIPKNGDEQGFIAIESAGPGTPSFTQFVDRAEAYRIAREATAETKGSFAARLFTDGRFNGRADLRR